MRKGTTGGAARFVASAPDVALPRAERRRGFNLQIPESLYRRLYEYVQTYATREESMTYIILEGIERELDRRIEEIEGGVRKVGR
jgi:hypothetical protein